MKEQKLSFPLRDITYQIIISCTRLYTFEKKRENGIRDKVWRLTNELHVSLGFTDILSLGM